MQSKQSPQNPWVIVSMNSSSSSKGLLHRQEVCHLESSPCNLFDDFDDDGTDGGWCWNLPYIAKTPPNLSHSSYLNLLKSYKTIKNGPIYDLLLGVHMGVTCVEPYSLKHGCIVGYMMLCLAKILDFSSENVHRMIHGRVIAPVSFYRLKIALKLPEVDTHAYVYLINPCEWPCGL